MNGMTVNPIKGHVFFGPNNEKATELLNSIQAMIIDVTHVHYVKSACFYWHLIQYVDVMNRSRVNFDKSGYRSLQVKYAS